MQRIFSLFFTLLTISTLSFAQSVPPQIKFRSPVDFPIRLSGTFGELRSGHFHAGIDIKTYEQTGKVVKAIADGYISRIKISAGGYGKTLYVTHNNGYTSVFAHLKTFNRTINKYVRKLQLKKKTYEMDVAVPRHRLYYNKGNIIAYTGNSGYSMGPHLHFEIRETDSQKPVNPLYFGFDVQDNIPPTIHSIKVYSQNKRLGPPYGKIFECFGKDGNYALNNDTITIPGSKVSLGIRTIDRLNNTPNHDGVYKIRLLRNDTVVFAWSADRFSFHETRYINSLIDYNEYRKSNNRFVRTQRDPFNALSMYETVKENGVFSLPEDTLTHFEYQVFDIEGNRSAVDFFVKPKDTVFQTKSPFELGEDSVLLEPDSKHSLSMKGLDIDFPKHAFYREVLFHVAKTSPDSLKPFDLYTIGDSGIPLHKYITIKSDSLNIADSLMKKAVWGRFDDEDGFEWRKSRPVGKRLGGVTRDFGLYTIKIDTVSPDIEFLNVSNHQSINSQEQNTIRIQVKDTLTAVKNYEVLLNNKWVIAEYDAREDELVYRFDEFVKKGENSLKVGVEDVKRNGNVKSVVFRYNR
ncbi:MAG: M23 family metallopeptidase [Bacteroidales bacterium]|nr:M23 family metallopeptidase [Bacteroidales bacterium]